MLLTFSELLEIYIPLLISHGTNTLRQLLALTQTSHSTGHLVERDLIIG